MAEHLASIFGTERDRLHCPFFLKIGACRHGDRCSRAHNKPLFSPTLLFSNMYVSPAQIRARAAALGLPPPDIPPADEAAHFEDFYEDVHAEMSKHGRVDMIVICENRSDHLAGNTYVKFADEDAARAALAAVAGRVYAGRPLLVEYSPVTELTDGKCRKFEEETCERGDFCHFMHTRRLSEGLYRRLYAKRPRPADRDEGEREASRRHLGAPRGDRDRDRDRDRDYRDTQRGDRYREPEYLYGYSRDRERERDSGGGDYRRDRDRGDSGRRGGLERDSEHGYARRDDRERYSRDDRYRR
jgi:splicing factor U2AF 35 kDa subunit